MNNKTETITGQLSRLTDSHGGHLEWRVLGGYGSFPLAKDLQSKPQTEGYVEATVAYGIVTDYHFAEENF